ncbi:MAG TPA: peptidoglycan DD-metalloendopeptidase family protein [Steroidobacteraceae bacterium]|nr:peptidoglycan DD-metalloendopeptidase family protein [Steroidobacteraceae bacterium]
MSRKRPGSIARWLPLLLLWAIALPAADEKETEADLKKVRRAITELQQAIRSGTTQRDQLAGRLRDAELTFAGQRRKLDEVKAQRVESAKRRAALQAEHEQTEQRLTGERDSLAGELRAAYTIGREEQLKLLLNQQEPAQLGRMFVYYGYFGRARADRIQTIRTQLDRLGELDAALAAEDARLADLQDQAQSELDGLQRARRERGDVLKDIDQQIKTRQATLTKLKREEDGLEKLLADLRRVLSDFPVNSGEPFEKLKGRLSWPAQGKLLADFGQRRASGLTWNGVLLATDRGSQVRAVHSGRVVYADWLPGMGLLTIVEHSGGYLSLYGHNEQLFRAVGDWVSSGDVIASSGDSGGRSQSELYFEIRKGATPLNPHQWIRKPLPRN